MRLTRVFGKELRALLPAFLATMATLWLATGTTPHSKLRLIVIIACLGPIALGSLSIGHEYAHRTVTFLLAQPIGRRRLLLIKAAVVVPMIAAVAVAALFALRNPGLEVYSRGVSELRSILVLGPLCGLCLAPALSMLCRSALAAIVFTIAIPGMLMLSGEVIGTAIYGFRDGPAVEAFKVSVVSWSVSALCVAGAAATWLLFTRLQAIEGHGDLQMPAWLRTRADRTTRPRRIESAWLALLRKELHLHQLTFAVVALYLFGAAAIWALQVYAPEFPRIPIEALSVLYCGLLIVLIGSVPSAEERQLGTLSSQLLQPIAAWQQWAIKAGTAIVLALLLGIALPLLVNFATGESGGTVRLLRNVRQPFIPVLILISSALYVSSLSSSGVRAMISSGPVIVGAMVYAGLAHATLLRIAQRAFPEDLNLITPQSIAGLRRMDQLSDGSLVAGAFLVFAVILTLAYTNHRRLDRSRGGIAMQAAVILVAITLVASLPALIWIALRPGA